MVALLIAFLVGLLPGTVIAWQQHNSSDSAQREVAMYRIRDQAGMSAMYARRGEYDRARVLASSMFGSMRARVDQQNGDASSLDQLRQILAERDEIITLLARSDAARSDAASSDRLLGIQHRLIQALPTPE